MLTRCHCIDSSIHRAFLASAYMKKDTLGARVIQSKHTGKKPLRVNVCACVLTSATVAETGRWRYACKLLHEYAHEHTSPGRRSAGYTNGYEDQASDHGGQFDRNIYLYAALEIKLSMTGHAFDNEPFDSMAVIDRVCGGYDSSGRIDLEANNKLGGPTGWRVATESRSFPEPDVALNEFSPIVAYGSLEFLRSMRSEYPDVCIDGFNEADGARALMCEHNDNSFRYEMQRRRGYGPWSLQKDQWCDASKEVTVENSLGNPFYFDENLLDTKFRDRFNKNNLQVYSDQRGEEKMTDVFRSQNLMAWVYVTSSGDPQFRAGMYRLLDLPAFRKQACSELPRVQCSPNHGGLVINPPTDVMYIDDASTDPAFNEWHTGREGLPYHRCSKLVTDLLGSDECHRAVYRNRGSGCVKDDLPLVSRPTRYGATHWISRLQSVPSPSPPPPPPTPSPPPSPEPPLPPPSPPEVLSQQEVMRQVRIAEERMCTSVYYLSQETRCARLAIDLTQRVLMRYDSPPSLPRAEPIGPGTPPPPPSPLLPEGLYTLYPTRAMLSTMRLPPERPAQSYGPSDVDGFYRDSTFFDNQAGGECCDLAKITPHNERVCVPNAPLPCVSGILNCLNGQRRCGTADLNGFDPWLDAEVVPTAGRYIWAVEIHLPVNQQLAELIVGAKTIELFGDHGEPVACFEGNHPIVGIDDDVRVVTVICHPPDGDEARIRALATVKRMRLTLVGTFRQIWVQSVRFIERTMSSAGLVATPPPPPPPPAEPAPPSDPGLSSPATCTFHSNEWLPDVAKARPRHEPCGQSSQVCCNHATENGAAAFELDDAGCCDLYFYVGTPPTLITGTEQRDGAWSAGAGTGII